MENNNYICHIDMSKTSNTIKKEVARVWGKYSIYHIFNVEEEKYISLYEELANFLGEVRMCHPVNDKATKFSISRDIKYDPEIYHYFASNERQPLHTDYAYYKEEESPEWLMLYCVYPSEFGGKTNLLTTATLNTLLKKYNPELLEKILKLKVRYHYNGVDGEKTHTKMVYDGVHVNWNYWQIKENYNDRQTIEIAKEFFNFLENTIVSGSIYDFSKAWKPKDCIIFNDRLNLHGRDSFLGDRWLKDHAFFKK